MNTIVFRTTNECNLRCKYCYDNNNHGNSISRNIATNLFEENKKDILLDIKKIFESSKKPSLLFHGGEPLMVDPILLSEFCDELNKDLKVRYSIQTNATLIDKKAIELFRKHNFSIGISIDGANEYQNAARIYKNGKNSFNSVMKKMQLLNEENIKFGVVISINKLHIGQEQELYNFLADNKINCNIRPVFSSLDGDNSLVMSEDEYVNFFQNLFDIWFNDKAKKVATTQIREFFVELQKIILNNYRDRSCECSPKCFLDFISLDTIGNLYACNRFYNNSQFYYGNIRNMTMEEVNKKAQMFMQKRYEAIKEQCHDCNLLDKCYGGCPAEAYNSYGLIDRPSDYCKIKKRINEYVKSKVQY